MDKQKRNAGITLIALVISIIVMLILAGVSINATVGDNGILKQAMEASNKQKLAQEIENLNLELAKLNIDTITNNEADTIQDIVDYLVKQGVIDEAVKTSSGAIAVGVDRETGTKYFFGKKGEHIYKISRGKDDILVAELTQSTSGGDITGGSSLVTADSFNNDSTLSPEEKGKFNITSDANVAFMDTISGELCFYIKSGVHAVVEIYADMTLTNEGIKRSAIDIEPGGTLDLYVGEGVTLTVDSGFAVDAERNDGEKLAEGGAGGYAGIHVPWIDSNNNENRDEKEQAELNLYGEGTIIAIGGNASIGNDCLKGDSGGAGGGGAGAGIGGNGGQGGDACIVWSENSDGRDGENCGIIKINDSLNVTAIGGAGASSGVNLRDNAGDTGSGTGAGGYPAAGIGGGGAGGGSGNYLNGGGGYSGASCERDRKYAQYHNGQCETELSQETSDDFGETTKNDGPTWMRCSAGGGYFARGARGTNLLTLPDVGCNIGGEGAAIDSLSGGKYMIKGYLEGKTGSGGYAGEGGIISVSSTSNIKAENGNECTLSELNEDGTKNNDYYYKPLEIDIQKRNL